MTASCQHKGHNSAISKSTSKVTQNGQSCQQYTCIRPEM